MTPFVFYLVGGYLAITGRLDIGQLVAVIAAYKDLPSPLKDLIDWDQQRLDVQVKYTQVVESFTVGKVLDPALQKLDAEDAAADRTRNRGAAARSSATNPARRCSSSTSKLEARRSWSPRSDRSAPAANILRRLSRGWSSRQPAASCSTARRSRRCRMR